MYNDKDHILASLYFDFRKFPFYNPIIKSALGDHAQEIMKNTRGDMLVLQRRQLMKANFKCARGFVIADGCNTG